VRVGFLFKLKGNIMKKILFAVGIALSCCANISIAQENTGGSSALSSTSGGITNTYIVVGIVALGVFAGVVANGRGSASSGSSGLVIAPEPIQCGAGEVLVDGQCVPGGTTTTVTTTNTVTGSMTTPVNVTATTTL
jgi:hypothetical protein